MYPCCKLHRPKLCDSILALTFVLLCAVCDPRLGLPQAELGYAPTGVSSDAFLKEIAPGSLPSATVLPNYPLGIKATPAEGVSKATFSPAVPNQPTEGVTSAQFVSQAIASPSGPNAIGSGVAMQSQSPVPTSSAPALSPETKGLGWRDRLGLNQSQPNFMVGYLRHMQQRPM